MPNTSKNFNPAYSTIKAIYLTDSYNVGDGKLKNYLNILRQNKECRFERLETVENINDVFPNGSIGVTDLKDIASYIGYNNITNVIIQFFDGSRWNCDITSASYSSNAASDTEDNIFVIHFTNGYYRYFSSNTLTELMSGWGYSRPTVFTIDEFVTLLKTKIFGINSGYNDSASNYFLYKPLIPFNDREETIPDNAVEMLNYVSTAAVGTTGEAPNFLFWTSFGGDVNFKYFQRDLTLDPSYKTIDADYRNIAVFNGDAVLQKLSDKKIYRKAYFFATNPAFQWISKNYYYVRKTPKYLDELPTELLAEDADTVPYTTGNLAFHFQDDGEKYNIDIITIDGRGNTAPKGGDRLMVENRWGYFDGNNPTNNKSNPSFLSNNYGTNDAYQKLNFMGITGYMPFLDSPDMWKNMFDLTPIHPNYPEPLTSKIVQGKDTYLDKIMQIRYYVSNYLNYYDGPLPLDGSTGGDRLTKLRQIEKQNFVMYSLCCMGNSEDCFFAALQRYEIDSTYYSPQGPYQGKGQTGPNGAKYYRYKWNKLNFTSGVSGLTSAYGNISGITGNTYEGHQIEQWSLDPSIKSSDTQDKTWAINLNERGLTGNYLPPGWVPITSTTSNFKYRPIGAKDSNVGDYGDIVHIARVCIQQVGPNDQIIYFWAENVLDGTC